ncbi:uncharacterized protein LTR77_004615 [Saxophila tyrrhenica]|uniref:Sulfatase N-terminal domain-containing protein n=1 Tax=Saxophila tyrrhenica TaxID=1690608 RepID=A0AAV9PHJ5_9PEZI|nr:hypothetical protein LTR77_004615 [Saxophila tyrrhenica]
MAPIKKNDTRPNFLVILADDLGYSDIGCFGSEIRTPHLDALARNGARFSDYHTAAACSPTRSMLLSGTDNHIAGVGIMSEQKGRNPDKWDAKGHEGFLNHDVAALPEILQDNGYHTLISGKWHLGYTPESNAAARGFDRAFTLLPGASNHYGWEPQFDDKDYGPFFSRVSPQLYTLDGRKYDVKPNLDNDPKGFFSSDSYTDNLVDWMQERNEENREKPFFAYLPFSAPHWPLQCSDADRDRYEGVYDDGPEALRLKRLENMKKLGIIGPDVKPHEVIAGPMNLEWDAMTPYERRCSARAMQCFAGMVDNIDQNVGKIVQYLKRSGEFDNTVIIFQSDNGAEGADYEAIPTMGADLMRVVRRYYNNSFDNIGHADSYVWYGTRWAQASTAPSRLYKMYSTEGGIKVPFIMHYPKFSEKLQKNAIVNSFSTVMDLCPTFLEMAGIQHPASSGNGTFRGREVAPMRGKSWVDFMTSSSSSASDADGIHSGSDGYTGWELFGRGAVRQGSWKLVHIESAMGGGKWQLYDLSKDPGETNDLAEMETAKRDELIAMWEDYVKKTGVLWTPYEEIETVGEEWGENREDLVGGNHVGQIKAWMQCRQGEEAPKGQVVNGG